MVEPIRKNIWMGWLIGGFIIVIQGGVFLGVGLLFRFLFGDTFGFHFSLIPFHLSFDLHNAMILGGLVATLVGIFSLGYGIVLYRRERAWDQR